MGVDTKMRIPTQGKKVTELMQDISQALKDKLPIFGEITIDFNRFPKAETEFDNYEYHRILFALDYPCDQYESGKEQRMMSVYFDHYTGSDHMLYLSIGAWGHNEAIAKAIIDSFGGYADFYDCDEITIDYAMPQPKITKTV